MAKQYSNRSDLRNPAQKVAKRAAKGQTYGEAGRQMAAQDVVPMAKSPSDAPAPAPAPVVVPGASPFTRATERPMEPGTYGADAGPGPSYAGSGLPQVAQSADPVLQELLILYKQFPNDGLANLISVLQYGGL